MLLAFLSLLLTGAYAALIGANVQLATAVGPIYTLAVLGLWLIGHQREHHSHNDDA